MTIEQPIQKFTLNADGIRKFSARVSEGLSILVGLRMILAAFVLLPTLISKNPIIDTVSISTVVALVGWSIVSTLRLRKSRQAMNTYTIIIDNERVTADMENTLPFSIRRNEITSIERDEAAFIVMGKANDSIIIPRGVNDPQGLQFAIRELERGVGA